MRISRKLPLAAALVTLFAISAATAVNLYIQRQTLFEQTSHKLEAIADGRRNEAKIYLDSIKLDLLSVAGSPSTTQAYYGFTTPWPKLGADPTAELQKRYIDDNSNPIGQKQKLDSAKKDSYDRAHFSYHPGFRAHLEAQGYYDMFLFDLDGNVVYTVFKERDFASNVVNGKWKDTQLAKVYSDAMAMKDTNEVVLTDFTSYEPSNGQPAAFMSTPIWNKDRKIGILAIQLPNDRFNSLFGNEVGLGQTGQTLLVRQDGVVINDPARTAEDDALKTSLDTAPFKDALASGAQSGITHDASGTLVQFSAVPLAMAGVQWFVVTTLSEQEALSAIWSSAFYTFVAAALIIALAMAAALTFSRSMTRPITSLVKGMAALARGDTSIALEGENRNDEVGEMIRSVAVFKQAAIDAIALEKEAAESVAQLDREREVNDREKAEEQAELKLAIDQLGRGLMRLSAGDLTIRINTPLGQGLDQLRLNFNASLENLAATMEQVKTNAHAMTERVRDVSSGAGELAHRTSQQATALTQTSAAVNQIMVATRQSSERAIEASRMAQDAQKNSDSSSSIVMTAIEAMERIEAGSGEISKIINVIDEIAFQTNLLALNAGVEAARAGEAGKGFAVVAQEVRELAQRSANAAKDIKNLITKSGEEVAHGVALVEQTGSALTAIADHVTRINDRIQQIADAAKEQSASLAEINRSMTLMEETTRANGDTADQTNENMTSLSADAEQLSGLVDQFVIDMPQDSARYAA